jgi:iron-sulfur cluster repair protein YtfE (RIC family)|tara:strand:- start:948 stop:1325 length:378 start_codon:yes stop_codon:yes gene_type:complete
MKINSLDQIKINLNSSRIESLEKTIDNILKELHEKHNITLDLMNYSSEKIEEILGEDDELNVNYLSLYDYLGHAAGGELGQKIALEAAKSKIIIKTKSIENPGYKGKIQMYPEPFLTECTNKNLL